MPKWSFFRSLIDKTFIDAAKFKAETRNKFNLRNILITFGVTLIFMVVLILFFIPDESKRDVKSTAHLEYNKPSGSQNGALNNGTEQVGGGSRGSAFYDPSHGIGYGTDSGGQSAGASRNRNANQVIRRGANGNDPSAQLPMGTTIGATLLTSVLSTNTASPVIALITQDVQSSGGNSIPQGTKVIGSATFDEASRRISIRFHTLVYLDGDQHQIQAVAMMNDGSAGVSGDYHSGEAKRQIGKFMSNFVGGIADGMKERTGGGLFGSSIEPGSIKNGLLNGVELSAEDQAKSYSDDLTSEKGTMSINAGSQFLLFLEKEYLP